MENGKNEELSMNWWDFWKYFIFPVGILISIGSLTQYDSVDFTVLNFWGWLVVIANLGITLLLCVTYGLFLSKKRQAFNVFIIYLFLYPAWNTFIATFNNVISTTNDISELVITGLISYGIICGIWIYPNYIYFKKRKDVFDKKEEKTQKIGQEQEDEELKNIINNIEKDKKEEKEAEEKENNQEDKEKKNKKYCTKCGKMIDNEWAFCNYCGNKLK